MNLCDHVDQIFTFYPIRLDVILDLFFIDYNRPFEDSRIAIFQEQLDNRIYLYSDSHLSHTSANRWKVRNRVANGHSSCRYYRANQMHLCEEKSFSGYISFRIFDCFMDTSYFKCSPLNQTVTNVEFILHICPFVEAT